MAWPFDRFTYCGACGMMHPEINPTHDGYTLRDICPACNATTPHSLFPECHDSLPSENLNGVRKGETV